MENILNKISHIVIETVKTDEITSKTFSSKPVPEKERKIGKIFGCISIHAKDPRLPDFINFVVEQIKLNYQLQSSDEKNPASLEINIESALENALSKTNIEIFAYLEKEKISFDLKKINILAAVLRERELVFSIAGSINAYLIHQKMNGGYQIINVHENYAAIAGEINPLKFFTQTIYGQIHPNDTAVFCTFNVLDYLSLEKIKNIITQNDHSGSSKYFKTILSSVSIPNHFLITLANVQRNHASKSEILQDMKTFDYERAALHDSIKKLSQSEKNTQNLLNPSLQSSFNKFLRNFQGVVLNYSKQLKNKALSRIALAGAHRQGDKSLRRQKESPAAPKRRLFPWKEPLGKNRFMQSIFLRGKYFIEKFIGLPLKTKIIGIVGIILFALFIESIIKLSVVNTRRKENKFVENILREAQVLEDAAEASKIYQDEDAARGLYLKAANVLGEIPEKYKKLPSLSGKTQTIQKQLEALRYMTTLEDPAILGNWKNIDANAVILPWLAYANTLVYAQNEKNSFILTLDPSTHIIGSLLPTIQRFPPIKLATNYRNDILLLSRDNTLFSMNVSNNSIQPVPLEIETGAEITAMKTFNNSLYLLDPKNNQIYKYSRTARGFTEYQRWIRDDIVEITSAVDFAIDGNLYVMKKSGEIIKLLNGKLANFSLKTIDPPLRDPSKLITSGDSNSLYVLDPAEKRVIVLDKNGSLIKQFTSEAFRDLKDFVVMEKQKRIYVLSQSSVYGFALE